MNPEPTSLNPHDVAQVDALVLEVLDPVRDAVPRRQPLRGEAQLPQPLLEGQRVGALDRLPRLPGRLGRRLLGLGTDRYWCQEEQG